MTNKDETVTQKIARLRAALQPQLDELAALYAQQAEVSTEGVQGVFLAAMLDDVDYDALDFEIACITVDQDGEVDVWETEAHPETEVDCWHDNDFLCDIVDPKILNWKDLKFPFNKKGAENE